MRRCAATEPASRKEYLLAHGPDEAHAARRQCHGRRRVVASTRQPAVTRELEYLEEALQEAEAAARWYAERSVAAAAGFSDEIDAAESAIVRLPEAWPPYVHGARRYLLQRFPFSVVYRVEARRILIVAVAHARRRPGYWKSRL